MDLSKALSPIVAGIVKRLPWRAAAFVAAIALLLPSSVPAAFYPDPGKKKPPLPKAPKAPPIGSRIPLQNGPSPGPLFFAPTPSLALPPDDPPKVPEPATITMGLIASSAYGLYVIRRRRSSRLISVQSPG